MRETDGHLDKLRAHGFGIVPDGQAVIVVTNGRAIRYASPQIAVERLFCRKCDAQLAEADQRAQKCSRCGREFYL